MYRIFKESYPNFVSMTDGYRLNVAAPFSLLVDLPLYNLHKRDNTPLYQALSDFLFSIRDCPKCQVILDDFNSLGIVPVCFNVSSSEDLLEQHKILHMFLRLVYW